MSRLPSLYRKKINFILNRIKDYKPKEVFLFGSLARGQYKKETDIDLFIVKETQKSFMERQKEIILNYLIDYDWDVPLDFVVYTPKEVKKAKKENRIFIEEVYKYGRRIL